jgi:hypothetical protein
MVRRLVALFLLGILAAACTANPAGPAEVETQTGTMVTGGG